MYQLTLTENIIRGDTWDGIEFTIVKGGTNYTGAQIKVQFRRQVDATVYVDKTITPTTAINGQIIFTVALNAAEAALLNSDCVADIQITTADAKVETSILININLTKDVTK
jgi:hypothetical protein